MSDPAPLLWRLDEIIETLKEIRFLAALIVVGIGAVWAELISSRSREPSQEP